MASDIKVLNVKVSDITLLPYYYIGIVATTIGILVVVILNFFTPLDSIHTKVLGGNHILSWEFLFSFFLPRLMFILGSSYIIILYGIKKILNPVSFCMDSLKKGIAPESDQIEAAQKRILNLHFFFAVANISLWILIPCLVGLSMIFAGIADSRIVIILSARASMVGLIASAIASQRIENISRKQLIPVFFPKGGLSAFAGIAKLSISRRIMLVNSLGAVIPLTILLVTLLTLQWEVETSVVTAREYGRGIIIFTLILFVYTLFFSKELNRLLSRNIVGPIKDLVVVLQGVQKGRFDGKVQIVSNDEVGYAGEVVNQMTQGLYHGEIVQKSLDLAREIQQNLLPKHDPDIPGLDIAGHTIYCDETGGDYYDYLLPVKDQKDHIRIVLGDVSGHGISSALLMTTSRALFRQRSAMPGSLAQVTSNVNRHLCEDMQESGNFVTLFCVEVDPGNRCLKWVRAGHDPGILYNPVNDSFIELKGKGVAMGIDELWQYEENEISGLSDGHIVALFTDGIWEAQNVSKQRFGKEKLYNIIRKNADLSSRQILDSVIDVFHSFQKDKKKQDDITLIIIKIGNKPVENI